MLTTSTKRKKISWIDRLPKPIQRLIEYSVVIILIAVLGVIIMLVVGPPKAAPQTNFIADYDCVTVPVVSYDTVARAYIVSYKNLQGQSTFVILKPDKVKVGEPWKGDRCTDGIQR